MFRSGRETVRHDHASRVPSDARFTPFVGTKREALAFVWSHNATRRDLTPSQRCMVNAERESLDAEYAAEIEKMRKAAASRPQDAPKTKATPSGSSVQQIVPTAPAKKDTTKLTDSKIATEVGGNRTYVSEARKLHSERPDLAKKVKAGTMSIPQADDHNELDPARRHVMSGPVSLVESANSFRGRIGPFSTKSPSFHDFPLFLAME